MFFNMTPAARNATREDFLTYLQEKIKINNNLRFLPEPQARSISTALDEAKKLSQQPHVEIDAEKLEELNQVNRQISAEIPTVLPNVVTLEWIQSYCEDRSKTLMEDIRVQRLKLRKKLGVIIVAFMVGLLCVLSGIATSFPFSQVFSLWIMLVGSFCLIGGIVLLQGIHSRTADINKAVEKQDLLNKLKMTQLLIEQITDEERKNAIIRSWLESILVLNIKPGEQTPLEPSGLSKRSQRNSLRSIPNPLRKPANETELRRTPLMDSSDRLRDVSPHL